MADERPAKRSKTMLPVNLWINSQKQYYNLPISGQVDLEAEAKKASNDLRLPQASLPEVKRQLQHALGVFREAPELDPTQEQYVILKVEFQYGSHSDIFFDRICWNINTPSAMLDVYAARVANDMGHQLPFAQKILQGAKTALKKAKQQIESGELKPMSRVEANKVVRANKVLYPVVVPLDQVLHIKKRQAEMAKAAAGDGGKNQSDDAAVKKEEDEGEGEIKDSEEDA